MKISQKHIHPRNTYIQKTREIIVLEPLKEKTLKLKQIILKHILLIKNKIIFKLNIIIRKLYIYQNKKD